MVWRTPEVASPPRCLFLPWGHGVPFLGWCLSGSRWPAVLGGLRAGAHRRESLLATAGPDGPGDGALLPGSLGLEAGAPAEGGRASGGGGGSRDCFVPVPGRNTAQGRALGPRRLAQGGAPRPAGNPSPRWQRAGATPGAGPGGGVGTLLPQLVPGEQLIPPVKQLLPACLTLFMGLCCFGETELIHRTVS